MSISLWLAALVSVFTFWLHTVVGHLTVHRPMQRLDASDIARGTTAVCWHLTTALLGFQALYLWAVVVGAVSPRFVWILVGLGSVATGLFLVVNRLSFRSWFVLPQWTLLGTIAGLLAWHMMAPVFFDAHWTLGVTLATCLFVLAA
ncbi:MAG: hypothetical protein AAFQ82_14750, partial [Myxococcota bacterium]